MIETCIEGSTNFILYTIVHVPALYGTPYICLKPIYFQGTNGADEKSIRLQAVTCEAAEIRHWNAYLYPVFQ